MDPRGISGLRRGAAPSRAGIGSSLSPRLQQSMRGKRLSGFVVHAGDMDLKEDAVDDRVRGDGGNIERENRPARRRVAVHAGEEEHSRAAAARPILALEKRVVSNGRKRDEFHGGNGGRKDAHRD